MKPDYPPLLSPGRHTISLQEIERIAVLAYPNNNRRKDMFELFLVWLNELRSIGVSGTLWIDGSFLTAKPDPSDIDCILWNPTTNSPLTSEQELIAAKLTDQAIAHATYGLDFYLELPANADEEFHKKSYWMGILGFGHDRKTAKGFAEIIL